jgi:hypothetical protein
LEKEEFDTVIIDELLRLLNPEMLGHQFKGKRVGSW